MKKQKPIWAIVFGAILVGYTAYVMLDAFVIVRPMQTNATEVNYALFAELPTPSSEPTALPEPVVVQNPGSKNLIYTPTQGPLPTPNYFSVHVMESPTFYSNNHLSVSITEVRAYSTTVHIAEVSVSSAQYLMTAFAKNTYGRNIEQKTSTMAKANDAILAINGDNYGSREGGYVIRNGILYRSVGVPSKDLLCIMPDGDFQFIRTSKKSAQEILDMGAWQVFSFGPILIDDGKIAVKTNSEVDYCYVTNPRTVIGMVEPLHYYIAVADGRTKKDHGLSLYQMAEILLDLGCTKAYNLDGGGSSSMVFRGKVINFPTTDGTYLERGVTDIVFLR